MAEFAAEGDIPVIRFAKGQRKLEVMRPHLDRLARAGETLQHQDVQRDTSSQVKRHKPRLPDAK